MFWFSIWVHYVTFENYIWFMTKTFGILLLPDENKNKKMLSLLEKWVSFVWVWFYLKPTFGCFLWVWSDFLAWPNPCTPLMKATTSYNFLEKYLDSCSFAQLPDDQVALRIFQLNHHGKCVVTALWEYTFCTTLTMHIFRPGFISSSRGEAEPFAYDKKSK